MRQSLIFIFFFFNDTATTEIYTLSLHDALPIYQTGSSSGSKTCKPTAKSTERWKSRTARSRSEEHTSELQSPCNLVCRLLLEKKKKKTDREHNTIECTIPTPEHSDLTSVNRAHS